MYARFYNFNVVNVLNDTLYLDTLYLIMLPRVQYLGSLSGCEVVFLF